MTPPPGTVPLPVPMVDGGVVAMDAGMVTDGGTMDASVPVVAGGDDGCGCAVPGRTGGANGWMGAVVVGLWMATQRRRR